MKRKKILIHAIILIMTLAVFATPVFAATLTLGGSSSVTAGSTISISIVVGSSYGAEGTIKYDTGKLTYLSYSAGSGWNATYASSTKRFTAVRNDGGSAAGTILTLKFRANSSASGTTKIEATNVIVDPAGTTYAGKTITINKPTAPVVLSSDATLKSLSVSEGSISPAFAPATTSYKLSVPYETEKLTINAQKNNTKASVSIPSYTLSPGDTVPVRIVVTAENGDVKTYIVQTTRELPGDYVPSNDARLSKLVPSYGALSPAFNSDITHYAIDVPYECTTMTFTGETAFQRASYNVLGSESLKTGPENTFYVVVMAEDGKTAQIYTVTVRRSAAYSIYLQDDYVNDIVSQITEQTAPVLMDLSYAPVQVVATPILTALKDNPDRQLVIKCIGARFTIKGSDLTEKLQDGFYDFTVNPTSRFEEEMMAKGSEGQSMVFSTHHSGPWPGTVEYAIETEFLTGTEVNIYRFDPDKTQYTVVAESVMVNGGTVAFKDNQGGDYLITTAKLGDAVSSEDNIKQPTVNQSDNLFYLIVMGLTLFPLGVITGIIGGKAFRKHRKNKAMKQHVG